MGPPGPSLMTIAKRVRSHPLWADYMKARRENLAEAARQLSLVIAMELDLTERQRLVNLPKIAAQTGARGRPRSKERCPHCGK